MDEQTSFEARAVLPPRRARLARFALLLPVIALLASAWAGLSGARPDRATADAHDPTAVPAPSLSVPRPERPTRVVGLAVQRLADVQAQRPGRDVAIAVTGWYVATAITDCPALAAIYRAGSLPEVRGDADTLAFCVRSGVLYASRPDFEDDRSGRLGSAVTVTIAIGVVVPPELELIGAGATEVVVVGQFVESGSGCAVPSGCRDLLVDHVAWTPGM